MIRLAGQRRTVVITAMGIAAPGALDIEHFWDILIAGKSVVAKNKRVDTTESGSAIGGEVPPFDLSFIPAELKAKRMARHTLIMLWAAKQIKDEVRMLRVNPSIRLGLGTSCLSMISDSGFMRAKNGPASASRYMISQCPPQAAAGALAQYLKTDADVLAISTACAAGIDAIGIGAQDIINGKTECVVAGGTDCAIGVAPLAEYVNSGLASLRNNDPARASRPFDVFADSGVCSEGAALFVLEEKTAAIARGANILAEVAGYGSCIDHDKNIPGSGWPACIDLALKSADMTADMIDSISAWGPGHPVLDRVEAKVLCDLLGKGASHVPIYSIKGAIGNPMAAGGPLMLASSILSLRSGMIPPNVNLDVPIPEAQLDLIRGKPRHCMPKNVLMNSHGVAGANACLIIRNTSSTVKENMFRRVSPKLTTLLAS